MEDKKELIRLLNKLAFMYHEEYREIQSKPISDSSIEEKNEKLELLYNVNNIIKDVHNRSLF